MYCGSSTGAAANLSSTGINRVPWYGSAYRLDGTEEKAREARGESEEGRTQSLLAALRPESRAIEAAIADNEMGFRCCGQTSQILRLQWTKVRGSRSR